MNLDLRDVMATRADSVEPPVLDPLSVVVDGERLVRRRRALGTAVASLVLTLTIGTTVLLAGQDGDRLAPSQDPVPAPGWAPGTRPLAYGQGQTLHLGDRDIDTGLDFLSLDLTDFGAALTTVDGGVWFSDGTTVDRVGTTVSGLEVKADGFTWAVDRPRNWVVNDSAGALLGWLEYPAQRTDRPELVVYDTDGGDVLSREPIEVADGNTATVLAIAGRAVFLAENELGPSMTTATYRYDVDSGALDRVGVDELDAARRGVPRALVVGSSAEGSLLHSPEQFIVGGNTVETLLVRDSRLDALVDPHSGDPVEIAVPEAREAQHLWFTQWLDDDRFAVVSNPGVDTGDLFVCRISAGRCDVVVDSSTWVSAPLMPGNGLTGAELALGLAMRAITPADG
jgi:hypothetical protein